MFKCGICGKEFNSVEERMKHEQECYKTHEEEIIHKKNEKILAEQDFKLLQNKLYELNQLIRNHNLRFKEDKVSLDMGSDYHIKMFHQTYSPKNEMNEIHNFWDEFDKAFWRKEF